MSGYSISGSELWLSCQLCTPLILAVLLSAESKFTHIQEVLHQRLWIHHSVRDKTKVPPLSPPAGDPNGDLRKTWQIIHDLTSRKAVNLSIREINLNGTSLSESSDLSNAFNDHFSSKGPKLANDIPLSNNNNHCHREYVKGINNRFEFRPTDSGQVLKLLNKLNKSKGPTI